MTEDGPVTADHWPQGGGAPSLRKALYVGADHLFRSVAHMRAEHLLLLTDSLSLTDICAGCSAAGVFYFFVRGEGRLHLRATFARHPGARVAMKGYLALPGQKQWAWAVFASVGRVCLSG